jgi:DNA-binding PadR family transcriptional regulator
MNCERPRKVYQLTNEGQTMLNFTEDSLNLICQKIGANGTPKIDAEAGSTMPRFAKKTSLIPTLAK